jgi:hypothetical protein
VPANSLARRCADIQNCCLQKLSEGAAAAQQEPAGTSGQHTVSTWNKAGTFEERDVTEWAKERVQEMVVGISSGGAVVTKCRSITGHANIWCVPSSALVVGRTTVMPCVQLALSAVSKGVRAVGLQQRPSRTSLCSLAQGPQPDSIQSQPQHMACLWIISLPFAMLCCCHRFIRGKKRAGFDFDIQLEWQQGGSIAEAQEPRGTLKLPSASPDDLDDLHCEVSVDAGTGDAAADEAARQAAKQLKQQLQDVLGQFYTELRSK